MVKKPLFFRHDSFRPTQDKLIADIVSAIQNKKNILCHASTGIGKTDASISAALTHAIENNLTVFFLTPKLSQHEMALKVISDLQEKYDLDIIATDFVGKRHMCVDPILSSPEIDSSTFYEICDKRKRMDECNFHKRALSDKSNQHKSFFEKYSTFKSQKWVYDHCKMLDLCAYEMSIKLASKSRFIVADYYQLLIPKMRDLFLAKTKKKLSESIVIIDEAHNLGNRVRAQLSTTLNNFMLKRSEKEIRSLGYDSPMKEYGEIFETWASQKLRNINETLVEMDDLKSVFDDFTNYAVLTEELGMKYLEESSKEKSATLLISKFLKEWQKEQKGYLRVLRRKNNQISLKVLCLDPSPATSILNDTYATILMSGTLVPLEMHRDLLGLKPEKTEMYEYSSPFPKENRVNIVCTDISTKYTKRNNEEFQKIADKISDVISITPGNTGVFFPSYAVLESIIPLIKTKKKKFIQKREMSPNDVKETIKDYKMLKNEGAVIFGVQGGSFSEGIDYANGEMKCAIVVGVGLDEMNLEIKGIIDYYQQKFGKGWEYGYLYPGVIKGLQASGRCIRSEKDRAVVVFMDNRFTWSNYTKCMPKDMNFVKTDSPNSFIKTFWSF